MHKIIIALIVLTMSQTQAIAGGHCFIKRQKQCFICPKPVVKTEVVTLEPKVIEQKIDQTIVNKTDVVNNLIMPPRLEPLVIAPPPYKPEPLTTRPFRFQPNLGPLPVQADPYRSPFVGRVESPPIVPVLLNNVVTRRTTATSETKYGSTTTQSSSSAVRVNPQTGEKQIVTPETKSAPSIVPQITPECKNGRCQLQSNQYGY